ncbi:MAG TPA: DinB family protein [Bryobacteraceae bacterium]|nr:DinB family protein [Bryobacteraceae bacterium]
MTADLARALVQTIERELPHLRALTDAQASVPRGEGKWRPKEELGHLIDSATNNHVRFAAASLSPKFRGSGYAQDDWVRLHGYSTMQWASIVDFWSGYNRLLVRLIERIPESQMQAQVIVGANEPVTLRFLIDDYILHMQHHIDLLLRRENVTQYPRA